MTQRKKEDFFLKLKKAPFWKKAGIVILVLAIGFISTTGVMIYAKKSETPFVRTAATIIPYPAAFSFKGGFFISYSQFLKKLDMQKKYEEKMQGVINLDTPEGKERIEKLRKKTLDELIEDRIFTGLAKKYNIEVLDSEVEEEYQKEVLPFFKDEEELANQLESLFGISIKEYKEIRKQNILKDKVVEKVLSEDSVFVEKRQKAEEILKRAKGGEDFAKLADEFSEYKEGGKGGDVGYIEKDKPVTSGEKVMFYLEEPRSLIFSLKEGQLADRVVRTDFGYHIFKVAEKQNNKVRVSQILIRVPTFFDWFSSQIQEMGVVKLI